MSNEYNSKKLQSVDGNMLKNLLLRGRLIMRLMNDSRISGLLKLLPLGSLIYLISPIDIIPDFIPVAGFIDDLLVTVVLLNKIINSADPELLEAIDTHWAGEDDVFEKVKEIVGVMNDLSSHLPKAIYNFMKRKE